MSEEDNEYCIYKLNKIDVSKDEIYYTNSMMAFNQMEERLKGN